MKRIKIAFWITTSLFSGLMLLSGVTYIVSPQAVQAFEHLGLPSYFRIELAIAKLIGALVLLLPWSGSKVKEWAYSGFTITLISAFVAHLSVGDDIGKVIAPIMVFLLLFASYISRDKLTSEGKFDL